MPFGEIRNCASDAQMHPRRRGSPLSRIHLPDIGLLSTANSQPTLKNIVPNSNLMIFPRFEANYRRLAVVNPIPYFIVSKIIADNWSEIRSHLRQSKLHFSNRSLTGRDRGLF